MSVHPTQGAFAMPGLVQSVVECPDNGTLIRTVAGLWMPVGDPLVVDATHGEGTFWTRYHPVRLVAHDLDPAKGDGVDCRALPEADGSVDVVVLDLPYIPQGGRDTSTIEKRRKGGGPNIREAKGFLDRYGLYEAPKTVPELEALFAAGIAEAHRVIRPGGYLWVKCMDYVSGGLYRQGRHFTVATAEKVGFRQEDEFIHYSGLGPQPVRDAEDQEHSRRAHSFLCVFYKLKRKRREPR